MYPYRYWYYYLYTGIGLSLTHIQTFYVMYNSSVESRNWSPSLIWNLAKIVFWNIAKNNRQLCVLRFTLLLNPFSDLAPLRQPKGAFFLVCYKTKMHAPSCLHFSKIVLPNGEGQNFNINKTANLWLQIVQLTDYQYKLLNTLREGFPLGIWLSR